MASKVQNGASTMLNYTMHAMGTTVLRDRQSTVVERTVLLASGHFRYLDQGDVTAPLILLAHGFPDFPKTFLPLMARLCSAGYRCVAPYLRGYAPSILTGPFDRPRVGDDLADLAEALCPDTPVVLIGHDMGAAATYTAVSRWPQRFRRAVTMAVPHVAALEHNLWHNRAQQFRSMYMAFMMMPGLPERLLPRNDFAYVEKLWHRWSPGYTPDPEYMRELKAVLLNSMPGPLGYYRALRPSRENVVQADLDARVPIYVPLLHLHGSEDGCISYEMGAGQDRFFKAEFHSEPLSGLGHFLHLEDPQHVAQAILDFIGPPSLR
jgi:pimeloyl-ACP methyl ester carboxylesterase